MSYLRRASSYQLLRLAEETGRIGFWRLDLLTGEISGSTGLAQIGGLNQDESPRAVLDALIHPEDRAAQAGLWETLQGGQAVERTFRILRPDRTLRWITIRSEVVIGADHRPEGIEGVVFDVTDPHETRALAEQSQARYRHLIEAIAAVVWTASPDGQAKPSATWQALTGQSGPQMRDGGWLAVVHPEDRPHARAAWLEAIAQGSAYVTDYRVVGLDGRYRWFNVRATPLRNADGSVREWMGIMLETADRPPASPPRASPPLPFPPPFPPRAGGADARERCHPADGITGTLVRGARALLNWSIADLASAAQLSVSSVKRFEEGPGSATRPRTRDAMRRTLEAAGIRFVADADGRIGVVTSSTAQEAP